MIDSSVHKSVSLSQMNPLSTLIPLRMGLWNDKLKSLLERSRKIVMVF